MASSQWWAAVELVGRQVVNTAQWMNRAHGDGCNITTAIDEVPDPQNHSLEQYTHPMHLFELEVVRWVENRYPGILAGLAVIVLHNKSNGMLVKIVVTDE